MAQPIMLPELHVEKVCLAGTGPARCSFLMLVEGGYQCAKGTDAAVGIIAARQAGTLRAMGNNCSGPPDFNDQVNR